MTGPPSPASWEPCQGQHWVVTDQDRFKAVECQAGEAPSLVPECRACAMAGSCHRPRCLSSPSLPQ
ncbi:hypothetical protein P7K49_032395, partial [Saguinus oedipus]